jgi:hypothetical protein
MITFSGCDCDPGLVERAARALVAAKGKGTAADRLGADGAGGGVGGAGGGALGGRRGRIAGSGTVTRADSLGLGTALC